MDKELDKAIANSACFVAGNQYGGHSAGLMPNRFDSGNNKEGKLMFEYRSRSTSHIGKKNG